MKTPAVIAVTAYRGLLRGGEGETDSTSKKADAFLKVLQVRVFPADTGTDSY